jgi:hypothetical protein
MGGGRKRGRTQRRHFKQGRENVWKHNPQRPPAGEAGEGREGNPSWQPFATENPAFEEYYKVAPLASDHALLPIMIERFGVFLASDGSQMVVGYLWALSMCFGWGFRALSSCS